ncbi:MAG TPA: dihydroorotase [Candidatus Syntrophoarchaeum butanivorans]|uniref:Dihydroorotase n=1 Tax=Candidatus Syntropharchaeum butanivorans TaxID=1839936 RepID=A0A7C0X3C7_9EURY|nr:dihydroorotase [Candidatus Syntrophoarchaeum butanivorans]
MTDLLIKNAKGWINGELIDIDLRIEDGVISEIRREIRGDFESILDIKGKILLPGAIDAHVHMRDGNESHKEDWLTGTSAAAAGGVTTVIDQPNTDPPVTSRANLSDRIEIASRSSLVDFLINGGVERYDNIEELYEGGVRVFGEIFLYKLEPPLLRQILDKIWGLGGIATIHAESRHCISKNPDRPPVCEIEGIKEVISDIVAEKLHFCHISTPEGVDLIRSKGSITLEVTPHHLLLSRNDIDRLGGFGLMNPPLRSDRDREGLWGRLDRIDIIASDHAPHTRDEKLGDSPPPGVPGVETMLPLMLYHVKMGRIGLNRLVELVSERPADIFGLYERGKRGISIGADADLVVIDMRDEQVIRGDELHSKCGWTPFEGMKGIFPQITLVRGEVVYDRSSGVNLSKKGFGIFLGERLSTDLV